MYCPKCGYPNEDHANFCNHCGSSLNFDNSPTNEQSNPQNDSYQSYNEQGNPQDRSYENHNAQNHSQNHSYESYDAEYVKVDPYSNQPYYGHVRERSIPLYLVLSIITCGIFGLYWYVTLVDDLNTAVNQQDDTSGIMVLILTLVTCGIYGLYWMYKAGDKVSLLQQRSSGYSDSNLNILYLIVSLLGLGIVNYALIQNELNKVANY